MKKVNVTIDPTALPKSMADISKIKNTAAHGRRMEMPSANAPHTPEEEAKARSAAERARQYVQSQGMAPISSQAPVMKKHTNNADHLTDVKEEEVENTQAFDVPDRSQVRNYTFADMLGSGFENSMGAGENPFPEHGTRITLPSRFLFNSFKSVFARPLEFPQLCLMYAAKVKNDESMFIDILNETISCDIRELCKPDFTAFMYWQRLHSFVTIPFTFTWRSRYGNDNVYEIKRSKMNAKALDFTEADLEEYEDFSLPNMRTLEEYRHNIEDMKAKGIPTDAYELMVSKAQFCKGHTLAEKIELSKKMSMHDLLVRMPEFVKKFSDFGVVEEFEALDRYFNAEKALSYLQNQADRVSTAIDLMLEEAVASSDLEGPMDFNNQLNREILRIQESLKTTGEAAPSSETRKFSIAITDFFPGISL